MRPARALAWVVVVLGCTSPLIALAILFARDALVLVPLRPWEWCAAGVLAALYAGAHVRDWMRARRRRPPK